MLFLFVNVFCLTCRGEGPAVIVEYTAHYIMFCGRGSTVFMYSSSSSYYSLTLFTSSDSKYLCDGSSFLSMISTDLM